MRQQEQVLDQLGTEGLQLASNQVLGNQNAETSMAAASVRGDYIAILSGNLGHVSFFHRFARSKPAGEGQLINDISLTEMREYHGAKAEDEIKRLAYVRWLRINNH